jgi:hypothetical protein
MKWLFDGEAIDSLPDDVTDFVYLIKYTDGTKYIGKKVVRSERRLKPLKGMRKNAKRTAFKESDWRKYEGSSEHNEGREIVEKSILHLCYSKMQATYLETKELFCNGCLESEEFNNRNILGKFFKGAIK